MTRLHDALRELSATWVSLGLDPLPHLDDGLELLRTEHDLEEAAGTELEAWLGALEGYNGIFYPFGLPSGPGFAMYSNRDLRQSFASGEDGTWLLEFHEVNDWVMLDEGAGHALGYWAQVPEDGWECSVKFVADVYEDGVRRHAFGSIAEMIECGVEFLRLYAKPGMIVPGCGPEWPPIETSNPLHQMIIDPWP